MAPLKKLKNEFFFIIRDKPVAIALKIVKDAPMAHLTSCYKPTMQTPLFFACARAQGQDAEALALCKLLVGFGVTLHWVDEYQQTALYYAARQGHTKTCAYLVQQGIDVNHLDRNSETALFYAATRAHLDTALTLMDKHSRLDVVNRWGRNIVQVAAKEIGPKLQAEVTARKRKAQEISSPAPPPAAAVSAVPLGPPLKRRRVAAMPLEALREWADEWPAGEVVQGQKIEAKPEDFIRSGGGYAVVKTPVACAARLRVSEKHFVVDHAELLVKEKWFADVAHDCWCRNVGVIDDTVKPPHDPINAIKAVLSGQNPTHFTLSLVHLATNEISGYVHCMDQKDEQKLSISHLKVDSAHQGKGLGGMLIRAAEDYSHKLGWKCATTGLSVLEANSRAVRCYAKYGFELDGAGNPATWGADEMEASAWQRWTKSHPHAPKKGKA
ncbi:unnamed protein product [Effrenium voratum]|nr:unnamed protein product [Effrenium voratum]